jgi:hypothetical protein
MKFAYNRVCLWKLPGIIGSPEPHWSQFACKMISGHYQHTGGLTKQEEATWHCKSMRGIIYLREHQPAHASLTVQYVTIRVEPVTSQ